MKKTMIFMGAGASRAFGFPLTKHLLPLVRRNPMGQGNRLSLNKIFPGFDSLKDDELPLITDLLSLIDYLLYSSCSPLPHTSPSDLLNLRTFLEQGILQALQPEVLTNKNSHEARLLKLFTNWLYHTAQEEQGSVGIISTNYDIAVEKQLFAKTNTLTVESTFDFGFSWRDLNSGIVNHRPSNPLLSIYKLHGSLNWLECALCEHIYIDFQGPGVFTDKNIPLKSNTCHCGHTPLRHVIVAPSLVRDIKNVNLLEVWKAALELLRISTEWIIVGYSFPAEDMAIRALFIRAFHGRSSPPKIRIVQNRHDDAIYCRYQLLFRDFEYETGGFEQFIDPTQSHSNHMAFLDKHNS
jgi:hypothetical protein